MLSLVSQRSRAIVAAVQLSVAAAAGAEAASNEPVDLSRAAFVPESRPRVQLAANTQSAAENVIHRESEQKITGGPDPRVNPPAQAQKSESPSPLSETTRDIAGGISFALQFPMLLYLKTMRDEFRKGVSSANKVAWGIFAANDAVYFLGQLANGAGMGAALQAAWTVVTTATFIGSLAWGISKGLKWNEWATAGASAAGFAVLGLLWTGKLGGVISPENTACAVASFAGLINILGVSMMVRDFLAVPDADKITSKIPSRAFCWGQAAPWISVGVGTIFGCVALKSWDLKTVAPQIILPFVQLPIIWGSLKNVQKLIDSRPSLTALLFKKRD